MKFADLLPIKGFRLGDSPPEEWLVVVFEDGGLGDHIARLSAIKYIIDEYPHVKLTVRCPKFFVEFAKKAVPQATWKDYNEGDREYTSQKIINAGSGDGISSYASHLVDHAFFKIVNQQVENKYKNYVQVDHKNVDLTKFNLPKKYVIITTGFTAAVRELIPSVINDIVDYINTTEYKVVFLGSKEATVGGKIKPIEGKFSDGIDFSKGLDLRDRTSLIEAHAVIAEAETIVGLDNGLLHVAGCTDIPIVMGFTTVDPLHRVPYRNDILGHNTYVIEPPKSLSCRGCQSNMNFLYGFDFRNCYYKDMKCVKDAKAQPYIDHLKKILC